MQNLISQLRNKSIHVVGVTGAEGSSILRFLVKHSLKNITVHDFLGKNTVEQSFRLWHKGLSTLEREKLLQQFKSDLTLTKQNLGQKYLTDIDKADIVFIPQSWRLYKEINAPLFKIAGIIPFYSITRLYLDFAPAKIIAVTGTVGKGSTANIIFQLLKNSLPAGRRVYFAGNDTWMLQLADKLDEMSKDDILILEISHRQLQDGFSRAPNIAIITNLYSNHLDETGWEEYVDLKLSLVKQQQSSDIAILNYDIPQLKIRDKLKSKVFYFSEKELEKNTKNIQNLYEQLLNNKSNQYQINILAGMTAVEILGINIGQLIANLPKVKSLPARLELIQTFNGIHVYDDIKSTTPWATMAALNKLGDKTILICGGKTKGIDYTDFARNLKKQVKLTVGVKSEVSKILRRILPEKIYKETDNFKDAMRLAFGQTVEGDNILISPAAGFFYSDFIRGKESLREIITSLPPKEQV